MSPPIAPVHSAVAESASWGAVSQPNEDTLDAAGSPDSLTLAELLGATVPLISAPAYFGPPVIFLLGPWLILVLLLIPPAAVLITLVLVALLGVGLLAAIGALIASPYLLVRHLRARHRLTRTAPAVGEEPFKQSVRPRLIHLTTR